ncbi:hypothetical protein SPLC1_S532900 [Arthrospira platensis C1]|nr:hypothetical protein SPLC1_S532900 [Arthrospira platensis C1]
MGGAQRNPTSPGETGFLWKSRLIFGIYGNVQSGINNHPDYEPMSEPRLPPQQPQRLPVLPKMW